MALTDASTYFLRSRLIGSRPHVSRKGVRMYPCQAAVSLVCSSVECRRKPRRTWPTVTQVCRDGSSAAFSWE